MAKSKSEVEAEIVICGRFSLRESCGRWHFPTSLLSWKKLEGEAAFSSEHKSATEKLDERRKLKVSH